VTGLITLEVGMRELKVTQTEGRLLTRQAAMPLPANAIEDGLPHSAFLPCLVEALGQAGIEGRLLRLAIPDVGIAVRDFVLPNLPRAELASAVTYEAKRLVPIDPATVYYAWHARRIPTGTAVYVVAARRELVDAYISGLGRLGILVEHIDLKPLALARGAEVVDGMLLEWGVGEATLVLVAGGRPRFFRTFLLDTEEGNLDQQLDEIAAGVSTLVKFVKSAEPGLVIGPSTPLNLAGRFLVLPGAEEQAYQRFGFAVRRPAPRPGWSSDFPWPLHLAALGLARQGHWENRLSLGKDGEVRAAA
jgi:hypothetical protein